MHKTTSAMCFIQNPKNLWNAIKRPSLRDHWKGSYDEGTRGGRTTFIPINYWWFSVILARRCVQLRSWQITYRKTSYISRTLVGNKIVDNSDVVGASPVGAAPTTSSFST